MRAEFDMKSGRHYSRARMLAVGAIVLMVGSTAVAQTAGPASASKPDRRKTQLSVMEEASKMTVGQKQATVEKLILQQRKAVAETSALAREVNQTKDLVRLNCVDQKLEVMRGLLQLAETSSREFQQAVSEDKLEKADSAYVRIVISSNRSQRFAREAQACVGRSAVYTGVTQVELLLDADTPGDSATMSIPPPPGPIVPPAASTF